MEERPVKNVGFIIVSTDRGLCGGLNINLFRKVIQKMNEFKEKNVNVKLALLGTKASAYFNRDGFEVLASHSGFGDNPQPEKLVGAIKVMTNAYMNGEIDAIYIANNVFKNTMVQIPECIQLLPLVPSEDQVAKKHHWDYLYEPEPEAILKVVLDRYVMQMVYQAVVASYLALSLFQKTGKRQLLSMEVMILLGGLVAGIRQVEHVVLLLRV